MDRVFDSVLDYLQRDGRYDMKSILVWGRGLGGYYAVRLAHTRREKLLGVVAHGAGTHNFLDRDWLSRAQHHEFPFA
jgi:dienelactone hydrolase